MYNGGLVVFSRSRNKSKTYWSAGQLAILVHFLRVTQSSSSPEDATRLFCHLKQLMFQKDKRDGVWNAVFGPLRTLTELG